MDKLPFKTILRSNLVPSKSSQVRYQWWRKEGISNTSIPRHLNGCESSSWSNRKSKKSCSNNSSRCNRTNRTNQMKVRPRLRRVWTKGWCSLSLSRGRFPIAIRFWKLPNSILCNNKANLKGKSLTWPATYTTSPIISQRSKNQAPRNSKNPIKITKMLNQSLTVLNNNHR